MAKDEAIHGKPQGRVIRPGHGGPDQGFEHPAVHAVGLHRGAMPEGSRGLRSTATTPPDPMGWTGRPRRDRRRARLWHPCRGAELSRTPTGGIADAQPPATLWQPSGLRPLASFNDQNLSPLPRATLGSGLLTPWKWRGPSRPHARTNFCLVCLVRDKVSYTRHSLRATPLPCAFRWKRHESGVLGLANGTPLAFPGNP
jgi:hypothetical protein